MPEDSNSPQQPEQNQVDSAIKIRGGLESTPSQQVETASADSMVDAVVVGRAPELEPSHLPFTIVGVGASAGGLEAYVEVLKTLPHDTGMAFVLVPHLAAEQKSHMVEILAHHTEMLVTQVQADERPEPNRVYIIPPNTRLSIKDGAFRLERRSPDDRIPRPIDHFFRSLAGEQKNRAIGVLLSGTDSDGALGLRTIKGEGGIAIVQQPDSARFREMPRSGIAADHVDLVLPPGRIGTELGRLAVEFSKPEMIPLEDGTAPASDEANFARILGSLRNVSGIEFRLYRPATLRRRIARRMMLRRVRSVAEYASHVQRHRDELRELHEDVLINVTRFFRDREVWESLKSDIFPRLFEGRPMEQHVRIWVPGCSTGEEAYTIAICLLEHVSGEQVQPTIQIFGTDASERSIQRARSGIYPESVLGDVSPERLRRFFTKVDHGYQIAKRIRDLCVFARQNLCNDPPFSKLDLISCRNVLIYMGPQLQKQIIPTFHYALRPSGYLLLGHAESIRTFTELFRPIDRRHKFYERTGSTGRTDLNFTAPLMAPDLREPPEANQQEWSELDLQRAADRIVLARYGPPGVLVNERMEILQSRGHTAPFLEMAPGAASLNLVRMLHDSIAVQVRDAVRRAIDLDAPVQVENLQVRTGDGVQEARLEVLPVHGISSQERSFFVLFVPGARRAAEAVQQSAPGDGRDGDRQDAAAQLQRDLASTKLYLQSLLDERDARNQELISANEEIQSANEELQSTNEELETTKEELQSANEELQTINEELQQRNTNLTQTSSDLGNLLNSVNMPVLMLSSDLRIRHFTPPVQRLMSVRSGDIGRPLSDIRMHLNVEDLEPMFNEVLETLAIKEMEVQDREGRWYVMRVRPYRTLDNKIDGVVVVLVDIDQLRRVEQAVRESRDFAEGVAQNIPVPLVVLSDDLNVRTASDAFLEISGLSKPDLNRPFPELAASRWNIANIRGLLEDFARQTGEPASLTFDHETGGPENRSLRFLVRRIAFDHERVVLVTIEDVTERKNADQLVERERQRLAAEVQSTTEALGRTQKELRALTASLFTSQEEERRRVARELHDDVSQQLALLQIDLEQYQQRFAAAPTEEARERIQQLRQRVASLADDVRRISHRLHPAILDDLGLPYALKALVEEFGERERMVATFTRNNVPKELPRQLAGTLYRITQEALRNIAKHAGRTHAKVTLERVDDDLKLEIADFGEGFDPDGTSGGLGLISMGERARLVNGTFSVKSALGRGTTVTVEVPWPEHERKSEEPQADAEADSLAASSENAS